MKQAPTLRLRLFFQRKTWFFSVFITPWYLVMFFKDGCSPRFLKNLSANLARDGVASLDFF
jgi:hypothetical protein